MGPSRCVPVLELVFDARWDEIMGTISSDPSVARELDRSQRTLLHYCCWQAPSDVIEAAFNAYPAAAAQVDVLRAQLDDSPPRVPSHAPMSSDVPRSPIRNTLYCSNDTDADASPSPGGDPQKSSSSSPNALDETFASHASATAKSNRRV